MRGDARTPIPLRLPLKGDGRGTRSWAGAHGRSRSRVEEEAPSGSEPLGQESRGVRTPGSCEKLIEPSGVECLELAGQRDGRRSRKVAAWHLVEQRFGLNALTGFADSRPELRRAQLEALQKVPVPLREDAPPLEDALGIREVQLYGTLRVAVRWLQCTVFAYSIWIRVDRAGRAWPTQFRSGDTQLRPVCRRANPVSGPGRMTLVRASGTSGPVIGQPHL